MFNFLIITCICIFSIMDANEEAYPSSCTCGYHIYNDNWSATVGEELQGAKKLGMRWIYI